MRTDPRRLRNVALVLAGPVPNDQRLQPRRVHRRADVAPDVRLLMIEPFKQLVHRRDEIERFRSRPR